MVTVLGSSFLSIGKYFKITNEKKQIMGKFSFFFVELTSAKVGLTSATEGHGSRVRMRVGSRVWSRRMDLGENFCWK